MRYHGNASMEQAGKERRRAMRTQVFRTAALGSLAGAALFLALGSAAQAQTIASDQTAGYVLFPKIISDPQDAFNEGQRTETVIQLTNTHSESIVVHCYYVNATGRCLSGTNADGDVWCRSNSDCLIPGTAPLQGTCDTENWEPANFTITLSEQQPTGWLAGEGRNVAIVVTDPNDPNGMPGEGAGVIPPVTSNFFQGELKCIEVDAVETSVPVNANHLKGEATIYVTGGDPNDPNSTTVDVRRYNAIGVQTVLEDGSTQNDRVMCLGSDGAGCPTAEYAACPERLILNHLFDGAYAPDIDADPSVTLVPCTQRITDLTPTDITVQMLVFNEYEQRFSLGTRVECYRDINLRELSILYAIGTQGTIAGQTVFKAVGSNDPETGGFGILGIAEQGSNIGSTAYNLVYSGLNANVADIVDSHIIEADD
jgi:hypothetical protein